MTRSHARPSESQSLSPSQVFGTRLSHPLLDVALKKNKRLGLEQGPGCEWGARPAQVHARGGSPAASEVPGGPGCLLKCRFLVHTLDLRTQSLDGRSLRDQFACEQTSKTITRPPLGDPSTQTRSMIRTPPRQSALFPRVHGSLFILASFLSLALTANHAVLDSLRKVFYF